MIYELMIQVPKKYDKFQISVGPDLTFQISESDDDIQVQICFPIVKIIALSCVFSQYLP